MEVVLTMPKGGARPGAGRKAGGKNRATIEREMLAAQQIDAARRGQRRLAVDEMEKALRIAERTLTGASFGSRAATSSFSASGSTVGRSCSKELRNTKARRSRRSRRQRLHPILPMSSARIANVLNFGSLTRVGSCRQWARRRLVKIEGS
jgi:hypothetical protein